MYTRILVPLDGSEVAEQVLPYVKILAKGLQARVELLGVFGPVAPTLADPRHGLGLDRMLADVRRYVQEYLGRVAAWLRNEGLTVSTTVLEGPVAASIAETAESDSATLVVLCTHGWSGTTIRGLGSTTDRVLYASAQPVFVIPARHLDVLSPMVELQVMLVPLDGSRTAEGVLSHVVALARALRATVILIRVIPLAEESAADEPSVLSGRAAPAERFMETSEAEARAYLESVRSELVQQGLPAVEVRVLHGPPSHRIVQTACEVTDCFVVLTAHGSGWTGGGIRGSVADRLVRHAVAPVLVIQAVKPASQEASIRQQKDVVSSFQ